MFVTDLLGVQFQIITHFQSINAGPQPGVTPPLSGNATWQSSLDSSRIWAVKVNGIDPDPNVDSCSHAGSIQCLLLQSVGNTKGATGGNLLFKTTFIQRLNMNGGAAPMTACTVGQTQLVPYTADYFFFKADRRTRSNESLPQPSRGWALCMRRVTLLHTLRMHASYGLKPYRRL